VSSAGHIEPDPVLLAAVAAIKGRTTYSEDRLRSEGEHEMNDTFGQLALRRAKLDLTAWVDIAVTVDQTLQQGQSLFL
jgi:hypothetical protein